MESILGTFRRAADSFRRFRQAEEGNYLVFVAISAIPMVAAAGLGVDIARGYLAEARLQSAIDSAAIAMGSADGTDAEITTLGETFFYANFPSGFWAEPKELTIGVTRVDPTDPTSRPESFSISAKAEINTLFFGLLTPWVDGVRDASGQYDVMDIGASSTALTEVKGLEIVMVLDVTGSMYNSYSSGERRIEAMRDAALSMVDILFGDNPEPELLRVAVVPYNTAVNIGTDQHAYVDNDGLDAFGNQLPSVLDPSPNPFGQTTWFGCVQARKNDKDLVDEYQSASGSGTGRWEAYRWPIEPDRRWTSSDGGYSYGYNYCETRADNTTGDYYKYEDPLDIETTDPHPAEKVNYEASELDLDENGDPQGWQVYENDVLVWTDPNRRRYYDRDTDGPNKGCPGALLPLTNNRSEVWNYLQDVTVVDGNGTITATGLNWGWRVISPGEPFTEGRPYDDIDWEKAIIVLTDGDQVISSQHGSCDNANRITNPPADQPPLESLWVFDPADRDLNGTDERNMGGNPIDEGPDYRWTAYGYVHPLDSAPLGTGNVKTILENRLGETCDAIKAVEDPINGGPAIQIFAITFGDSITSGDTISTMMSNCTTDPLNNYFHAPDTATLEAAFEDIARQLTSLRLTD